MLPRFTLITVLSLGTMAALEAQPVALSANSNTMVSRAPDSRGWTDPAMNHNRLLRERLGEGAYILVGTYKVKGSPYLFGGKNNADLFTPREKAYNIDISYNTYNQEVEFLSTSNPNTPLVKEAGEVDSFIIKQDIESGLVTDIKFLYGSHVGSSEKAYFQVVEEGKRFSLYKRYKADLGYVSDNYVQSDLRQFDLVADYFFLDTETKKFKKLKVNLGSIIKEFRNIKDLTPVAGKEAFSANPEYEMKKIFAYLNK